MALISTSCRISIHTPHAGSDADDADPEKAAENFNPHSPCGERPSAGVAVRRRKRKFQSTLPMRGATSHSASHFLTVFISIHTPHAGSDTKTPLSNCQKRNFNPHSPCGERQISERRYQNIFDFNPHSPCGERQQKNTNIYINMVFYLYNITKNLNEDMFFDRTYTLFLLNLRCEPPWIFMFI